MYLDSHAHLTSELCNDTVEEMVTNAKNASVSKIVNICTDIKSLERGLELSKKHSWIYQAAATTPHDVEKEGELFFPIVEKNVSHLVAIGETGLDYYYEHSNKETQKRFLLRYFALAKKHDLPLIIHCRDAFDDLFLFADEYYKSEKIVLHCFTGTLDEAKKVLDRGWYLSLSGIVTFKKSEGLREVAKYVPLDHLLIETDTPYLAPQSKRGKLNQPAYLPEIASVIAEVKHVDGSLVAKKTFENGCKFFSL